MIKTRLLKSLAILCFCLASMHWIPSASAEDPEVKLKPYRVTFKANYKLFMRFKGTAERTLTQLEDGSWQLFNKVSSKIIRLEETSRFDWKQNHPIPHRYSYLLKYLTGKRSRIYDFDYPQGVVHSQINKEQAEYKIVDQLLDRLTQQTALRADLLTHGDISSYEVAEKRNSKTLKFEIVGEELTETHLGTFNTLKIQRDRGPDSKRKSIFWLATDWDYLLVKAQQVEKGKTYELEILEGELDGKPITPLPPPEASALSRN